MDKFFILNIFSLVLAWIGATLSVVLALRPFWSNLHRIIIRLIYHQAKSSLSSTNLPLYLFLIASKNEGDIQTDIQLFKKITTPSNNSITNILCTSNKQDQIIKIYEKSSNSIDKSVYNDG